MLGCLRSTERKKFKTPLQAFNETAQKIRDAQMAGMISQEVAAQAYAEAMQEMQAKTDELNAKTKRDPASFHLLNSGAISLKRSKIKRGRQRQISKANNRQRRTRGMLHNRPVEMARARRCHQQNNCKLN